MVNGECGRIYVAKDAAAGGWTDIICNILISTGYYSLRLSLSPTALQPGVGLGLLQEFPPSFPV